MEKAPKVNLGNGEVVANFSSPHPFTFDNGMILPACSAARAKALSVDQKEVVTPRASGGKDVEITFHLTMPVMEALMELEEDPEVTVILVPFLVLDALKKAHWPIGKARAIRTADRITKTVCSDKFCM